MTAAANPITPTRPAEAAAAHVATPTPSRRRRKLDPFRVLAFVILAVLALLMGSGVALKLASMPPWWALVPASAGFVATVLLGRRYDAVLRSEITAPDSPAQR